MKRPILIVLASLAALTVLTLPGCAPPPGDDGPADPRVDAIFADLSGDRPGAAVGVLFGGEIVHRAGYGLANLDHGVPITPATVFDIASISKQFGAMAALLLEAEGALELDADVRGYVPELPDFGAVITPRHLIHHTGGIRDWPHTMALGGIEFTDVISFEKILRMLHNQQAINFPPGSEYAYSNTGYNLLARVIEVQSGMSFREYTHSRIFEPLGMGRTHFSDDYAEVVPGRAESYAPAPEESEAGGRAESYSPVAPNAAGGGHGDPATGHAGAAAHQAGATSTFLRQPDQLTALASSSLHTTIDDFILWMRNYETAAVGGDALVGTMLRRGILAGGDTIGYAHGLSVGEYRGLPTFGHGGSWVGFRTNFTRYPEQNLSIAVFCNVSDCNPARRARQVAEVYLGDLMDRLPEPDEAGEQRPAAEPGPPESRPERPALTTAQLQEYTGAYRSPELDSTYEIEVDAEGRLLATHWRNAPTVLTPTGTDTFTGNQWFFPRVRFVRDAAGRITAFTVTGGRVRDLIFERLP